MLTGESESYARRLQRAVQKVMKREMSDAPLHIVFALFDVNQDGNLASTELVTVRPLLCFTACMKTVANMLAVWHEKTCSAHT